MTHSLASPSSPARSTTPLDERPAPVDLGLVEVEPEERAGRLLALAPLGAAPVPGLGQLGVGADQLLARPGWRCGRRRRR